MKKKRRLMSLFMAIMMSFLLVGCSSGSSEYKNDSYVDSYKAESVREEAGYTSEDDYKIEVGSPDQMLIVRYFLNYQTKDFNEDVQFVSNLVNKYGAYYVSTNESGGSEYDPYSYGSSGSYFNATLMVPEEQIDSFVSEMDSRETLKSQNKSIDTVDVTNEYKDIELRLESLRKSLAKLEEMQEKEGTLENHLAIEKEISQRILDIERLEASKRDLGTKTKYVELQITINGVDNLTDPSLGLTFGERLKSTFDQSVKNFKALTQNIIIGFVAAFPYIFYHLVFILIIVMIIMAISKRSKKKRAKRDKERSEPLNNSTIKDNKVNEKATEAKKKNPDKKEQKDK